MATTFLKLSCLIYNSNYSLSFSVWLPGYDVGVTKKKNTESGAMEIKLLGIIAVA